MSLLGFFAAAVLSLSGEAAADIPPRDEQLTAETARQDIALARKALEELHPGYDRYTDKSALDEYWAALQADAEDGISRGALYRDLSEILAAIRCDHTKAELPSDIATYRKTAPVYLPFRFKLFDRRMYVTRAAEGSPLTQKDEILTIDGMPVATLIDQVLPLFPVDGDTDYIKEHSISDIGEFTGPAFDHFMPFLQPIEHTVTLEVRAPNGEEQTVELARLGLTDFLTITSEKLFSRNFVDAIRFEPLGDDGAYLAVDTFVNYRQPVSPDTIYNPIFEQLEAEGRTKLIVDLRQNGGGSTDASQGLFRRLINDPIKLNKPSLTRANKIDAALQPYLSSWDKRATNPNPIWFKEVEDGYYQLSIERTKTIKPIRGGFKGDIVMLTSLDNASGVTHLLSGLRLADRATFVGTKTGGAATGATAGTLVFLTLPNSKIRVRVPLLRTRFASNEGLDPRGGITPDILTEETKESFFAQQDPALDAAKAFLELN